MELPDLKIPSEWAMSSHLMPSSNLDISTSSYTNMENTHPERASYENARLLERPSGTVLHHDNTLGNAFTGTLDTSIYPVPGLHLSLETPLLQTGIETHEASPLNMPTNAIFNAVNTYNQANANIFPSNNSEHIFKETSQEKLKALNGSMDLKNIGIDMKDLKNNDTHNHTLYSSGYYEINGNKNGLSLENKNNNPFKFPGIAIPNLPFATIMDVQEEQLALEKTVQNKPNIIKKNETPVLKSDTVIQKNETPAPKSEASVPKSETLASKNETSVPKGQPRPKSPHDLLLYELRKCFSVYAVTGDTRNCVRTVYDLMKDIVEDKAKIIMLETLKGGMKDDIITAFIENKQVLGRIRNWLVNAINEKKNAVIIAILKIMSVLKLDAQTLAELKMGKPIMILTKKSENETVKQLSMKWLEAAEKSLSLEKSVENSTTSNAPSVPITEDTSKKKQKTGSNDSVPKPSTTSKSNSTKPTVKSQKVQPVVNTEFFKNLSTPSTKPSSQKPSLSSVLAQIKAPKKSNTSQPQVIETTTRKFTSVLKEVHGYQAASEAPVADASAVSNEVPKKKRKCVSWKSDNDLVEVRIFESLEPEETDNSFVHIFREFKNARDLDIYEGRAAFSKTHNMEDDMMTWREPEDIDFSHLESELPKLGPKRGGINKCNSSEYKIQEERERFVFLVSYLYEKDIPNSPTEPDLCSDGPFVETKTIPLPSEIKESSANDFVFQHNQGSINHLAFPNAFNQNNIPLTKPSLVNNTQASVTSILQSLLNASGQATINTPPVLPISQPIQHVTLPSSGLSSSNIANVSNILQMLQQSQKKPVQQSFPISSISSGTLPFNFDALLGGGQSKNHSYTDRNERNDGSYLRDKRHRSQRHRRR